MSEKESRIHSEDSKYKNNNDKKIRKVCTDIGVSAYLRLHGFKIVGRLGKSIYFEINLSDEQDFDTKSFEYINSIFHDFDSHVMAIKKIQQYLPPEQK